NVICVPLLNQKCQLPALSSGQQVRLLFFVAVPLTAQPGTATVTINGTSRSVDFQVRRLVVLGSELNQAAVDPSAADPLQDIVLGPEPADTDAPVTNAAPTADAGANTTGPDSTGVDLAASHAPATQTSGTATANPFPMEPVGTEPPALDPAAPAGTTGATDPQVATSVLPAVTATTSGVVGASTTEPLPAQTTTPADAGPETSTDSTNAPSSSAPVSTDPVPSTTPDSSTPVASTPVTSTTAAGTVPTTGAPSPTTTDPEPAALEVRNIEIAGQLIAGQPATLTLQIANTGGQRSSEQTLTMSLPDGVNPVGITVDGTSASAGLRCTLPEIDPGTSVTVVVQLTIAADARGGAAVLAVDGSQRIQALTDIGRSLVQHQRPPR
ncbi:MAG: hypothetical protein ABWZ02_01610, partial [Nakamurella sp.]